MTDVNDDLKDSLIDIIFGNSNDSEDWEHSEKHDLDNCGGIEVKVNPEDATTLDEVKSFTADVDVTGYIQHTYRRKINA